MASIVIFRSTISCQYEIERVNFICLTISKPVTIIASTPPPSSSSIGQRKSYRLSAPHLPDIAISLATLEGNSRKFVIAYLLPLLGMYAEASVKSAFDGTHSLEKEKAPAG